MALNTIDERKELGFNTTQRKYILRIEQYHLERETELLKEIIELRKMNQQNNNPQQVSDEFSDKFKELIEDKETFLLFCKLYAPELLAESPLPEMCCSICGYFCNNYHHHNCWFEINKDNERTPDCAMYDAILPEFAKYMRKELEANFKKGDRNGSKGWLVVNDNKFWISELYYHVGKLQAALMNNDIERIKENTADIANLAMMVLDVKIDLLQTK